MAVIKSKPTSPGRRFVQTVKTDNLHKGRPHRSLTTGLKKTGGRNNYGRMTTRHIGGGHKRLYREIDFKRNKDNISAVVERIEYDPNRSSHIALILYEDGERRYIIAPKGLKEGDKVSSGNNVKIATGNTLPLNNIPVGTIIHCIEMKPGKGAQIARSAGASVQVLAKEGNYATLRLKSGEVRKVLNDDFLVNNGMPDTIIIDPPRSGMHKNVIDKLLKILPNKIIYVSCNSATQARDLNIMKAFYTISTSQSVDMFPQTYHVENVVLLKKNNKECID